MYQRTVVLVAMMLLPIHALAQNDKPVDKPVNKPVDKPDSGAANRGSLEKDVIRRVIQRHIGEVKRCYEAQLEKDKDLAGKIMVRFLIGVEGKVTESGIQESTLKSPAAEKCIADAVRGWEFPRPRGGTVAVSYPFVLASSEPAQVGQSR
jgi:outer membrane biosynthesis protein TonB